MLYHLFVFFQVGRNTKGGFFCPTENMENAVKRNLSLNSDEELILLRAGAERFIECIEQVWQGRDVDDDPDPGGALLSCGHLEREHPDPECDGNEEEETWRRRSL